MGWSGGGVCGFEGRFSSELRAAACYAPRDIVRKQSRVHTAGKIGVPDMMAIVAARVSEFNRSSRWPIRRTRWFAQ